MNISITGLGIISAIGQNPTETYKALISGRSGIGTATYIKTQHTDLPIGEVKLSNEELKQSLGLPKDDIKSRTTLLGAWALRQAIADAGYDMNTLNSKKVVLISGTTVGGMDVTESIFKELQSNDSLLPYVAKHDCGSCTSDIASIVGLACDTCTISTACSSAVNSIIVGSEMLRNGEADIVIAGGTEALSRFHLNGFNTLMILDHERCRPFDATRTGLNLGEGAAFVVLEKNTANAKAYIAGYGNRCDAFHQTASSDDGEGAYLAMSDAMALARLQPHEIQYINAHGTGTPNNDVSEGVAIKRLFGTNIPLVSSTKSFTGHTTSASGSIETVISVLALIKQFVPGNLGWRYQIEDGITPTLGEAHSGLINVMCNSFGFGGNDSSVIISSEPRQLPAYKKAYNVCVAADVCIDSMDELKNLKEFISPIATRRMGKLMKASMLSSLKALKKANIEIPDAIVTATSYGMLETSETFLVEMVENGESALSPTLFMQSTHNTVSSSIAIRTKCHGYNITYSNGKDSMKWALRDARRLIETGQAESVLVGCHDESTELFQSFHERMGMESPKQVYSHSIVLRRGA